jgi:Pectinacetylesterase
MGSHQGGAAMNSFTRLICGLCFVILVFGEVACTDDGDSSNNNDAGVGDTDTDTDTDTDAGTDTDSDTDTDTDTDSDTDTNTSDPGFVSGKLPEGEAGDWVWVKFANSRCGNNSKAGLSVRYSDTSDNVMIFLEGGGACINAALCLTCPMGVLSQNPGSSGIFDENREENPIKDWNMVYVPYCTGDCHTGANTDVKVPGAGIKQFVGATNYHMFLKSIVETFPNTKKVLLIGFSAGGIGAAYNALITSQSFGDDVEISVIADGAMAFRDEYFTPCLQQIGRDLWGINENLPPDCEDCIGEDGGGLYNMYKYVAQEEPGLSIGLISSLQDATMRSFFGYGLNDCKVTLPNYPGPQFTAGLEDLRGYLQEIPFGGTYFFKGMDHGSTLFPSFFTKEVDGVKLVDWFSDIIDGTQTHVSP